MCWCKRQTIVFIIRSRIVDNPNDGGERRPGNTSFYTDVEALYRKGQTNSDGFITKSSQCSCDTCDDPGINLGGGLITYPFK